MTSDAIFHNGTIYAQSGTAVEACVVKDGKIALLGSAKEAFESRGPKTTVIDLNEGSLLPGIIDSHIHLQWYAESRAPLGLDVSERKVATLDGLRDEVRRAAEELPPGEWIRGRGWTERVFFRSGYDGPSVGLLDDVSLGHPVVLEHWSGHGIWVNSVALAEAGVTPYSREPEGGTIGRRDGSLTGYLGEAAMVLVKKYVTPPDRRARMRALLSTMKDLKRSGVTSITDPAVTPEMLRLYAALGEEAQLPIRVSVLLHWSWPSPSTNVETIADALKYVGTPSGFGNRGLRIAGVKLFADGVPSMRTAWMRHTYDDGSVGCLVTEGASDDERIRELRQQIRMLHAARFSVQVHATGDKTIGEVVKSFAEAQTSDPWQGARHSIIHCNFPDPEAMRMMKEARIGANVNSLILWNMADKLKGVIGENDRARLMPVGSLIDAGVVVADSSDAPVTVPDWRQAVETLVTRSVRGSGEIVGGDECVTRETALALWTKSAAWHQGTDGFLGEIRVGGPADLVAVAEDFGRVNADELHCLSPATTMVGGELGR